MPGSLRLCKIVGTDISIHAIWLVFSCCSRVLLAMGEKRRGFVMVL